MWRRRRRRRRRKVYSELTHWSGAVQSAQKKSAGERLAVNLPLSTCRCQLAADLL